ncbi:MAG: hypothetical protein JKY09_05100 [Crocinitomicaceae bacterium]|nr:hypothetical protein [Crocinitomicaceae bacterium]
MIFVIQRQTSRMKRYYILFLLLSILSLTFVQCSAESYSFDTINDRITGKWRAEKVKFKNKGDAFSKDVTDNFKMYLFSFEQGGYAEVNDLESGQIFDGYWYLWENWTWDDDKGEEEKSYTFHLNITDPVSEETRDFTWENLKVTNDKFRADEKRNGGKYTYHLIH